MAAAFSLAAVLAVGVVSVLAGLLPGLWSRRDAERDVAAVMAAHRVTDGPAPDAGLRRLLAAVRDGRAER